MSEQKDPQAVQDMAEMEQADMRAFPPTAFPPSSGLYEFKWRPRFRRPRIRGIGGTIAEANGEMRLPFGPIDLEPLPFITEELRIDVDGRYPQFAASGTIYNRSFGFRRTHWIADLEPVRMTLGPPPSAAWAGPIWYKDGHTSSFPYTHVEIVVTGSWFPSQRRARVTYSGGGRPDRVRDFTFKSPYYHPVNFEFDRVEGEPATTVVDTCTHPNRPATLACEQLTVENVFRRAGFDVSTTPPGARVPLAGAGANALWSDLEMHDAMQKYWSRFAHAPQWAMWVFFAARHERGSGLGGIMFDDIGPNHRQGTAIFNNSFISDPPPGDPNPAAWIQRMRFWTACHEMGHGFNLAHSWQKTLGNSWIPMPDEDEVRSFMNYPYGVAGGQTAFFSDFEYRFSGRDMATPGGELLFMRHAPARFVQMGNADWFDDHAFEDAQISPEPTFALQLRANRERAIFEFMEPVTLELKLTNISGQHQLVDEQLLSDSDAMTVILKKDGKPARQLSPYAQYCELPEVKPLRPNESLYEPLPVSAGSNGWDIAEPGYYTVQVALQLEDEDIVSNPLRVRIAPPRGYDEEFLAQDFFSDEVGRILNFGGSRFLEGGNDVLREVSGRLADRRIALHASFVLGNELARDAKQLAGEPDEPLGIRIEKAQPEEARQLMVAALTAEAGTALETFAHVEYKRRVDDLSSWLADQGEYGEAALCQDQLHSALAGREVHGRKVLDRVVREVERRRDRYAARSEKE